MMANRKIIVAKDAVALAQAAAERLIERIDQTHGIIAICLTGGSTPKRLYELLASPEWRKRIPWERIHWFLSDDRFVPQDDPWSNAGMARRAFLDACAPPRNVHMIRTDATTPEEAAHLYEQDLRAFATARGKAPLFDLVLLGVGPDGHVASIFPDFPAADEMKLWVAGVPLANVAPFVPRVTLTLLCLESTHEMLFLASGHDKKAILTRVFAGEALPAARAHAEHGETVWLIDEPAAPSNANDSSYGKD